MWVALQLDKTYSGLQIRGAETVRFASLTDWSITSSVNSVCLCIHGWEDERVVSLLINCDIVLFVHIPSSIKKMWLYFQLYARRLD